MKIVLCFVVAAFLAPLHAAPRKDREDAIRAANALIKDVQHAKARVDSSSDVASWLGYRPEWGGTIYGYWVRDTLRRIVVDIMHAIGMVRTECYYDGQGSPLYIYERGDYFPKHGDDLDRTRLEFGHESRFYLHNRTLMDSKRRGKDRSGKTVSPEDRVKNLLQWSDRWYTFMKH